jgi:hypothetical protein
MEAPFEGHHGPEMAAAPYMDGNVCSRYQQCYFIKNLHQKFYPTKMCDYK